MNPRKLRRLFPFASDEFIRQNSDGDENQADLEVPNPKPEPKHRKALVKAASGTKESQRRITLRITGYRVRAVDCDNFAGGAKAVIDQLRYCGLLIDDNPFVMKLEVEQIKVSSYSQEKTEIEILY